MDFSMEITGVFKDALSRQADEAVRIFSRENNEILNSKSEFNHPPIARIVIEKIKPTNHKQSGPWVVTIIVRRISFQYRRLDILKNLMARKQNYQQ